MTITEQEVTPAAAGGTSDKELTDWLRRLGYELDDLLGDYEMGILEVSAYIGIDPKLGEMVLARKFVGRHNLHVYARLHFIAGLYNANPMNLPGEEGDPPTPLAWSQSETEQWHTASGSEIVSRRGLFTDVQRSRAAYELYDESAQTIPAEAPVPAVQAPDSVPVVVDLPPPPLSGNFLLAALGVVFFFLGLRLWAYMNTRPAFMLQMTGVVVWSVVSVAVIALSVVTAGVCGSQFFRDLWTGHIVRFFGRLRRAMEADSKTMLAVNGACLAFDAALLFGVAPRTPIDWLRWLLEAVLAAMLIFFADALFRLRSRNNRHLLYITMGSIGAGIATSPLYFNQGLSSIYRVIPCFFLVFAIVAMVSWKKPGASTI